MSSVLFPPDAVLGDYHIQELLGEGGAATVYRATQPRLNRDVALKVIAGGDENGQILARFKREVAILAQLYHPNVVTILDYGDDADRSLVYYAMELADADLLSLPLPLPWRTALDIVRQAAQGLQALHEKNGIHRDVKPSNILLYPIDRTKGRFHVKIGDFGIAKTPLMTGAPGTLTTSWTVGTPGYMSPEQIGSPFSLTRTTDIYSLGLVLYELVTGNLPLIEFGPSGMPESRLYQDVPRLSDLKGIFLPKSVALITEKMLKRDPDDRYESMQDVIDSINRVLEGTSSNAFDISSLIHERRPTLQVEDQGSASLSLACMYYPSTAADKAAWVPHHSPIRIVVSHKGYVFFQDSPDPNMDSSRAFDAKGDEVESIDLNAHGAERRHQYRVSSRRYGCEEQVTVNFGERQRDGAVVFEHINGLRFQLHTDLPWKCVFIHTASVRQGLLICFTEPKSD